jgi:hypothetical protein
MLIGAKAAVNPIVIIRTSLPLQDPAYGLGLRMSFSFLLGVAVQAVLDWTTKVRRAWMMRRQSYRLRNSWRMTCFPSLHPRARHLVEVRVLEIQCLKD